MSVSFDNELKKYLIIIIYYYILYYYTLYYYILYIICKMEKNLPLGES